MFKRLGLLLLALCSLHLPLSASHAQESVERPYSLYVPTSYDASTPAPLLMVLHGFGSSGKAIEYMSGFDALAEENGFIVVYPNSVNTLNWNDGRTLSSTLETADDSAYLLGLLDELSAKYTIASDQIYLTGFAAGGSMALRLACDAPERFAKVVTVSTAMWSFHSDEGGSCQADGTPIDLLSILGTP
jgi:polyhydroxybutyrate depolymerase